MTKLKVPCWNDGNDCDKRQVGCRKDCAAWQEYEKLQAEYREQVYGARKTDYEIDRISAHRYNSYLHKHRRFK